MDHRIENLKEKALKDHIPIMMEEGLSYMLEYIEKNHIKNILEIGAAVGYSAICMASIHNEIHVTTVERDDERYKQAVQNIKVFHLEDRITIYHADAFDLNLEDTYDFIFIDAAKSQYIRFFEKFESNLKVGGTIFSDNLEFHGLTHTTEPIASRNVRGIVRKLNAYITFLKEKENFDTTFLDLGDGISISIKKHS